MSDGDLIERLKFAAQWSETEIDIAPPELLKRAADEIERLRRELRAALSRSSYHCGPPTGANRRE